MVNVDITFGIAPSAHAPGLIKLAEDLGYAQGYLFDTPFAGDDVWYELHRAAEITSSIRLGPAVLIPTLRHPMVNAAQTLSLHMAAPGRVTTAFGTGFSSRAALGQPPITWSYVEDYVTVYQRLLAGETTEWDGHLVRLMLPPALAGALPLRVPLLMSGVGPKGAAVSKRLGAQGLITMFDVTPQQQQFERRPVVVTGTVLDPGERITDERVRAAVGPVWALQFHFAWTRMGAEGVLPMTGGREWVDVISQIPERERHLAIHDGHLLELNAADTAAWNAGGYDSVEQLTMTGSSQDVTAKIVKLIDSGATEIMLQPVGPDIPRELEQFMVAARGAQMSSECRNVGGTDCQ
ncbi:5,10-methylene tetrahydromethanopterin reductase [Mycobacterium sp. 1100029.7]|nr:5,10-methylene tetrahydromethanopterin reductase [Mycobacterium sp. 1100029.7]